MNLITSVKTIPIPTVIRTWFSGRMLSTSMSGLSRYRWMSTPMKKRNGTETSSVMYGSRPR